MKFPEKTDELREYSRHFVKYGNVELFNESPYEKAQRMENAIRNENRVLKKALANLGGVILLLCALSVNAATNSVAALMPPAITNRVLFPTGTNPPIIQVPAMFFVPCNSNAPCQVTEFYQDTSFFWHVDARVKIQLPVFHIQRSQDLVHWTNISTMAGTMDFTWQGTDSVQLANAFYRAEVSTN